MDPDATFRELVEALVDLQHDHDDLDARDTAVERLRSLATWLERGGFPPSTTTIRSTKEGELP